jgi:hypothetical protein
MVIDVVDKSFVLSEIHFVSYFNYKNLLYINIINQIKITKNVKFVIINKILKSKISLCNDRMLPKIKIGNIIDSWKWINYMET